MIEEKIITDKDLTEGVILEYGDGFRRKKVFAPEGKTAREFSADVGNQLGQFTQVFHDALEASKKSDLRSFRIYYLKYIENFGEVLPEGGNYCSRHFGRPHRAGPIFLRPLSPVSGRAPRTFCARRSPAGDSGREV